MIHSGCCIFYPYVYLNMTTQNVYFPKLTRVKPKLTGLTLGLGVGFGLGLGRGVLVSAHPAPFAPDGSEIQLYIDDPTYFHEVVDTYPSLFSAAQNTIITAPPSILPPSASISFHQSTPDLPHPENHAQGCQHFRDSLNTAQSWFRWAYQAWLKRGT